MNRIPDKIIKVRFEELEGVDFPSGRFQLAVEFHGMTYKFLLNVIEGSRRLVALGSGALGRNDKWDRTQPRFSRWSWDFGASTINYDDPTLYVHDDILICWCVGTKRLWYLKDISDIIVSVARKLGVENRDLIFNGSSAGGFTSLMLATLVKDSVAIAEIPQIDTLLWGPERHWKVIKKHCFDDDDDDKVLAEFGYRFKVIELIKKERYIPNAFIIFGFGDYGGIKSQVAPFLGQLCQMPFYAGANTIKCCFHGKTSGHNVLQPKEFFKIYNDIMLLLNNRPAPVDKSVYRECPVTESLFFDGMTSDTRSGYSWKEDKGNSLEYMPGENMFRMSFGSGSRYLQMSTDTLDLRNYLGKNVTFSAYVRSSSKVRLGIHCLIENVFTNVYSEFTSKEGILTLNAAIPSNAMRVLFRINGGDSCPEGDFTFTRNWRITAEDTLELRNVLYSDRMSSDTASRYYYKPEFQNRLEYDKDMRILRFTCGSNARYLQFSSLKADVLKGKNVTFKAYVKPEGKAKLSIHYRREGKYANIFGTGSSREGVFSVSADIPADADAVLFRVNGDKSREITGFYTKDWYIASS